MTHCSGFARAGAVCTAFVLAAGWIPAAAPGAAPPITSTAPAETRMIGAIRGRVMEQTAPVHPLAAQPVRLQIVEPAVHSTRSTTTDAQGRFVFSGLPVGGGARVFLVDVEYGGVPYTIRVTLSEAAPVQDAPVSVFVATTDRSAVRGTVAFAVFELVHNALRVSIVQRLENETDQAVAVTDADPLMFPLPVLTPAPRAPAPVEFVNGWRDPRVKDTTITDTMPVLPGATEVAYAFSVAPRARTETLRWNLPYGAANVDILADPSLRISGPELHDNGIVTEHGRQYARWSGAAVPANGGVSVRVEGLPVPFEGWPWIAAGALALVLAVGLVVVLRRGSALPGRRPRS